MKIDVFKGSKRVRLLGRCDDESLAPVAIVRRVNKSRQVDLQTAAGVRAELLGTHNKFFELLVRYALVEIEMPLGATPMTDAGGAGPVAIDYSRVVEPARNGIALGEIASEEVFDALPDAEASAIQLVAAGAIEPERAEEMLRKIGRRAGDQGNTGGTPVPPNPEDAAVKN